MTATDVLLARSRVEDTGIASRIDSVDWLIDNAETYERLFESLRKAQHFVHIAQLAFDVDCAAMPEGSLSGSSSDEVITEVLIGLAKNRGAQIRIVLNASWILNTARPLRRFFAQRGMSERQIEVRGLSRFPHFMHAKLVLIDENEAFLLGSPFVNSYRDDGAHIPLDARRPARELGGRPLHDVSVHLRGRAVRDLEAIFASVWAAAGSEASAPAALAPESVRPSSPTRVVGDAPDGILPDNPAGSQHMLAELVAAIARARSFIYIEHQYLTSRPIAAALADALRRESALEIIVVLNQNPDLTAYRGWQNARLRQHGLLSHARVGVFTLWSTDAHPQREGVTRINQLFIHSKVIVIDDEWAAVGTSNLDGVSMGDYGSDFAGELGRGVFKGVRNVEVNLVIDARDDAQQIETITSLRERLCSEHLGGTREKLEVNQKGGMLARWRKAAQANARSLSSVAPTAPSMIGQLLPYSERAFPRQQLSDAGVRVDPARLALCYNPTWFGVHLSPHWIRNIF